MTDAELEDVAALLALCHHERRWRRQCAVIDEIEARYRDRIVEMRARKRAASGWVKSDSTWSRAA